MEKLNLTKAHKKYYTAKGKPEIVEIGPVQYLSITGKGDPSAPEFTERIQALYPIAYTIKFMFKKQDRDFVVPKLEGLWWYDERKFPKLTPASTPTEVPREEWFYRLLIRMPDYVSEKETKEAIISVLSKKGPSIARDVHLFRMHEGKCVQMLHTGPFSSEPKTLQQIISFIREHNLKKNGHHHEIYLSDFRKTPPERLKTILREPVK
ncbi:GyrI-like domain-containing protein [Sinomicrobium weinanense]|uniref:GyrI-like domain-containing protein n=1 Tax=Sinomicrobium weinanense TaxID=2842200 RepID=A0A926JTD0_9FLAO|nr:GyrI-like domain-containing protein [Sinomicrobium weinanense]MBC9796949.1 GyrI-like domain-containing protein [Sinomicrobium weinanense]MBU3124951.1 GyrI-like domain-containing protein [Sinomicrobium weinanense]